jgi:hypothetical protein
MAGAGKCRIYWGYSLGSLRKGLVGDDQKASPGPEFYSTKPNDLPTLLLIVLVQGNLKRVYY